MTITLWAVRQMRFLAWLTLLQLVPVGLMASVSRGLERKRAYRSPDSQL